MIRPFQGLVPNIDEDAWVAEDAMVVGSVKIGQASSVWFKSVIRSEKAEIVIGNHTNIQDNSVLHTDLGYHLIIGDRVTVGHQCIVHGCTIGDDTLIGMGAIIMNGATIGDYCIIGAGALISEHMVIPNGSVAVGIPAKIIKATTEEQKAFIQQNAEHYAELAKAYKQEEQAWKNM